MLNKFFKFFNAQDSEEGIILMDVLVSVTLSTIVALGLTQSALVAHKFSKKEISDSVASQLALEKIEELASVNPQTMVDGDQQIENEVIRDNISFRRQVDITINSDRSRTVVVQVSTNDAKLPSEVTLETAFALWGER